MSLRSRKNRYFLARRPKTASLSCSWLVTVERSKILGGSFNTKKPAETYEMRTISPKTRGIKYRRSTYVLRSNVRETREVLRREVYTTVMGYYATDMRHARGVIRCYLCW